MSKISVDLCFSGSGCRFPALAGSLRALVMSDKYEFARIAGVSGGSIVAAAFTVLRKVYGDERAVEMIETLCIETDFDSLFDKSPFFQAISFIRKLGLHSGNKVEEFIRTNIGNDQMRQHPDLFIPATELKTKTMVVFNERTFPTVTIPIAIRRSISAPFYFVPKYRTIKEKLCCFVDGGIVNNYPIDMFDDNKRPTIGVRLYSKTKVLENTNNSHYKLKDFAMANLQTMFDAIEREHIESSEHWAKTISVNTKNIKSFDFNITRADRQLLFRMGYEEAEKWLNEN